jgi:uncharacterized membrane protein
MMPAPALRWHAVNKGLRCTPENQTVVVDRPAHSSRGGPEDSRLARIARRRLTARRLRWWVRRSMLAIPAVYLLLAIALGVISPELDSAVGGQSVRGVGIDAARDVLTSTATGMIAFTGLVVSAVLLVVQFAAGQYSPRFVVWFRRDQLVKHAIGSFLAAPLFALVALREIELKRVTYSPDITVVTALALLLGAALLFLALLGRVLDQLRPRNLYRGVGRQGIRAARAAYPTMLPDADAQIEPPPQWRTLAPRELVLTHSAGVVSSFDTDLMVAAASQADVTVELVPGVGEFVSHGQVLLRVHGDGDVDETMLGRAVLISDDRTIEQDPAFAIRVIVDTAIRALSPAINDPTTATHALDTLEVLMRELARRDLDASLARDEHGAVRLVWRTPGWSELMELTFDEIRVYGAGSLQVCRRMRAALEDLRNATDGSRHAAIDEHLQRLQATVRRAFPPGSTDVQIASVSDRTGLGLSRGS